MVLYTTVGLLWETELDDPELAQAYTKAYDRWICEFCADSPRLVPTAHLSLSDPAAAAQDLDVPFAILEPQWTKGQRMGSWENVKQLRLLASVTASRTASGSSSPRCSTSPSSTGSRA